MTRTRALNANVPSHIFRNRREAGTIILYEAALGLGIAVGPLVGGVLAYPNVVGTRRQWPGGCG